MRDRLTPAEIKRMDRFVMAAGEWVLASVAGFVMAYGMYALVAWWRR